MRALAILFVVFVAMAVPSTAAAGNHGLTIPADCDSTFDNVVDQNFATPGNWTPAPPGSGDVACIPAGEDNVTISSPVNVLALSTASGLDIDSTLSLQTLIVSNGRIVDVGLGAAVNVGGFVDLQGDALELVLDGTLSSTGSVEIDGTFDASGGVSRDGAVLGGTGFSIEPTGKVGVWSTASFGGTVTANAPIDVEGSIGFVTGDTLTGSGSVHTIGLGLVTVSAPVGATLDLAFDNDGQLRSENGGLSVTGNPMGVSTGRFTADSGLALALEYSGTLATDSATFDGAGSVYHNSADMTFVNGLTIDAHLGVGNNHELAWLNTGSGSVYGTGILLVSDTVLSGGATYDVKVIQLGDVTFEDATTLDNIWEVQCATSCDISGASQLHLSAR